MGIKVFFVRNVKMIFAIELKRLVASASILNIIISKFYYKKKPYPIILFKIYKDLIIGLYCTILALSFAIV